ncbi:hypothetical protein RDI58_000611 [Solanum bulbocastanum]|uniref:SWIM-type domain-containing protein n=1 Tax=Solanum bulbocastanum TaxID=147425 RepID=A0AAN8YMG8_SOLBU
MMKYCQRICPKIMLKLEKNKAKAAECIATKSDQFHYQIEDIYLRLFSIDLKEKTCSCRRWDLTGIPCNHAIAAIWVKKDEPEIYVHKCYTGSSTIIESATSMQSNSFIAEQIVNQLNQPRVPKEQLRSSAFILEEISEHSKEVTRPLFIKRMGTQYVPISKLQEVLSQSRKRVGSDPRAKKKNVP